MRSSFGPTTWTSRTARFGSDLGRGTNRTFKGTATDPRYARHLLPRLAKRAGLEWRVHPHGLRHTHAADLALAGVLVLTIQQQLGHNSLTTTEAYLRKGGVRLDVARMIRPEA